jgi:hypothetical protein
MNAKQEQPHESLAHDTYDLAVGLRRRLADAAGPPSASVTSQLQFAARKRLGSARSRSRMRALWPRKT